MPQRNLLVFFLVSLLFFLGWSSFQNWYWPPRKPKPAEQAAPAEVRLHLPDAKLWGGLPGGAAAVTNVGGAGAVGSLAVNVALAEWSARGREAMVQRPPEEKKPAPALVAVKSEPTEPLAQVTLGDDAADSAFNIRVVLTSRGAGVRSLELNKFAEADRLGLPAQPPSRLFLIPDNPVEPSNLLFHYATSEDVHPDHPLDTLGARNWKVVKRPIGDGDQEAEFSTTLPELGVTLFKKYTLRKGTYHLGLSVRMVNTGKGANPVRFRYQLTGGHGLPVEGEWYTTTYRNAMIGLVDGQGAFMERNLQDSRTIGFQLGGPAVLKGNGNFIRYAGVANQFFASVVAVDPEQPGKQQDFLAWARPTVEEEAKKPFLSDITARVVTEPVELKPGASVEHRYVLYNGPVKVRLLSHLEGERAVGADQEDYYLNRLALFSLTDTPRFGFWSSLLIACTNVIHGVLWYLHRYIMPWSYGLCILLLTVLVRGMMFPISRRQAAAQARMQERMQEMAPDLKKLKEKYKTDPLALHQATQKLYAERGFSQFAMFGTCWMVFAQMPIFLGLYYALQESIHFRLANFLWIKNLAAPDMLVMWGERIPIISRPEDMGSMLYLGPALNILPIVWVALMVVQKTMMSPPAADEQQAMQQKMMKWMMIVLGVMFYKVAAGLCMYFIASLLWSLAERKLLPKRQPAASAGGATGTPARLKPRSPKDGNGEAPPFSKMKDMWEKVLKEAQKK